ncbi:MAG: CoA transferase [Dehalococcoidia bacterium]
MERERPLAGIRICDFTHVWAGPHAVRLLADLGADVLKIESANRLDLSRRLPPWKHGVVDPDHGGLYHMVNRGKKSVALDLKSADGLAAARALIAESDVVVNNFRPGAMERLGLGYEALRAIKPDIIFAALSGYGQTGPESGYVAYAGPTYFVSGLATKTGFPENDTPSLVGGAFCDVVGGSYLAMGIMIALWHRQQTGEGQLVDVSMWEATTALVGEGPLAVQLTGHEPPRRGNTSDRAAPHGMFRCADDGWLAVSIETDAHFAGLCAAIGRADLAADPQFADRARRLRHSAALDSAVADWCRQVARDEAFLRLQEHGAPAGPALSGAEMLHDRNLTARGFWQTVTDARAGERSALGSPWRFDGQTIALTGAPALGEHTDAVIGAMLGGRATTPATLGE